MEKNRVLKTAPSHKPEFEFDTEKRVWLMIFNHDDHKYYFSESNTWITDISKAKEFSFLHFAVNTAKKRGFNYHLCPEFNIVMKDGLMKVTKDGVIVGHFYDIFSTKQASDIVKDSFGVILSKMD